MRISIVSFTWQGAALARTLSTKLTGESVTLYARREDASDGVLPLLEPIGQWAKERFADSSALVFVGAMGIAVRAIAPYVTSKDKDPAVLVIDEKGHFVIPVLSGHLGGANALARRIADCVGAQAVLTTATDVNGLFAVDDWAREQGYVVENIELIRTVSGALLDSKMVCIKADAPIIGSAPGVTAGDSGETGIYVSPRIHQPFANTLLVRPKVLALGIGCKRGTSAKAIEAAVSDFLSKERYASSALCAVATIDLKADEQGLLEFCIENNLPLFTHSADELNAAEGAFSQSGFVRAVTGVDCVCERAAALHGELKVKKTVYEGITLALSAAKWEARL